MEVLNYKQTTIEDLHLEKLPKEVQEEFWSFFNGVPFIQNLVSSKRKYARDLPRDEFGRIKVDIQNPHILENMDYFRKAAITFQKTGKYTELKPNPNPNSEYGKWVYEEVRRCHEGMVRPSDGEWIPGDLYYFWNYAPMRIADDTNSRKDSKKAIRKAGMASVWDGHYLLFHYLNKARENGNHAVMLSARGRGKSYIGASLLAKRFVLGETKENSRETTCYITAAGSDYLVAGDQTLDKFQRNIDFTAQNTEWPRLRLSNSLHDMNWVMGYKDLDRGNVGVGNSVVGITSKNDSSKLRGTRAVLYILEEAGSFTNLLQVWNNMLPSVEQGQGSKRKVFGMAYAYGTSGDQQSDFQALAEMMYHPEGYHIEATPNIYDVAGKVGGKQFSFFFPSYLNNEGCYDKDGNSDVTLALKEILLDRYTTKKTTSDINAVVKRTAEYPIVPQEAIIQVKSNFFPVALIRERINQLENNPKEYDDVLVGKLVMNPNGEVTFKPTSDEPIRQFPLKNNNAKGALEIFKLPEKDQNGTISSSRYIIGHDPVNQDEADSLSLSSTFVIDLYTDSIAAEWTGRFDLQDESFEQLRLLGIFYNAEILYESNNKMCYAYFSKMNCTYMLMDTPEYLRERDIIKKTGYGNSSKGITATAMINKHEDELLKDWLLMPKTIIEKNQEGEEVETTIPNVMTIRSLALLKEASQYNPQYGNYDRIRSLGVSMVARNSIVVKYGGDIQASQEVEEYVASQDNFFKRNGFI